MTIVDRLREDLRTAMKARDPLATSTIRSVLSAVRLEEVSGKVARTLDDDAVIAVIVREAKQRVEAAEAFAAGGRPEKAAQELAEESILNGYLPAKLTDDEVRALVTDTLVAGGFEGRAQMGQAMRAVTQVVAGRADGRVVAGLVKELLG